MIKCPNCHQLNEEWSHYCNRCGYDLVNNKTYDLNNNINKKNKEITKTKVKKVKEKSKKEKREKEKKNRNNNEVVIVKQMSFLQKFLVFILFLICLGFAALSGFLAYHIYTTELATVPSVVGLSEEEATKKLEDIGFKVSVKEEITDNYGYVLNQSIEGGELVFKYKKITITVGIKDDKIIMPNLVGLHLESTENFLKEQNIKYEIEYVEDDTENIVLKQSVKANKEITNDTVIKLTVSKLKEEDKKEENVTEDITDITTEDNNVVE